MQTLLSECRREQVEELTTAEARELIDGIVRAGFKIMIFSGGEALTLAGILFLVQRFRAEQAG